MGLNWDSSTFLRAADVYSTQKRDSWKYLKQNFKMEEDCTNKDDPTLVKYE